MKRALLQITKDGLDTVDYYLLPSSIPRSVNVQPRASVTTDQDMLRHFQDAGLDMADFAMEPSHIRGARIIRKARDSSSSEDGETTGRLFEEAQLNISDFSVQLSPTESGLPIMPAKSTPSPPNVASTCFSSLSEDVLFIVAEHCDAQDLLNLCLASKAMKKASVPHIYRHVDLSTHNRGLVICYGYEQPADFVPYARFGPQHEHSDSVKCTSIPVNMIPRQETFIKTLMNRKEYRKYVRVLIWTFLPPTGHWRSFSTDVAKPAFWDLMRCLENIRRFDLADLSKNWSTMSPRASLLQGQYFPNASSIRLLGVMEPVIAASILSTIDPTKLARLTLDNVQCCGKAPYGTVFAPAPRLRPSTKAALPEYRKWWSVNSGFVWPGLMRGLLKPLTGRCTGLKSLTLRKVGDRNVEECDVLRRMNECSLLAEWSSFIESVSGTLEEFQFEQGPRQEFQFGVRGGVHPVRTMDRLFGSIVFPVLLAGPWPCLKVMEVRGVRSWMGHGMRLRRVKIEEQYEGLPFPVSLEDQLKGAVGQGVRVIVDDEGRRFDLVGRPGLCGTRMS
ncbi:MAG: hypothetical protein ALECFALPRED_001915 [Alectoria fallacina]|uniref:F-box domain-containing protein n=1 Tax=Alectoria fallacina TaxID=1903189 RepID=A0A8H3EFS9_9LECA|nr:MAG: hypothetical protein ALECFALPRED_001915 [Alectoria fallacina]